MKLTVTQEINKIPPPSGKSNSLIMNPIIHNTDFFNNWNQVKPGSIDLILTDPPYGCLKDLQSWDEKPDIKEMETIFNTLLKQNGLILMFTDLYLLMELLAGFTNHFQFRFYFIWVKPGGMPISKQRPINNTEFILVFRKRGVLEKDLTWNPYELSEKGLPYVKRNYTNDIPTRRKKKSPVNENKDGWRYAKATLYAPSRPNMTKEERSITTHPCQKPLALLRRLVKTFSNSGDIILDPFAGSGSTLVSAYKENRKSIGFELKKKYYDEAKQRINNLIMQEVLF